jgi:beta-galactosidase
VLLDGDLVGVMDRRNRSFKVHVPARKKEATLDILVEPMGRVNFGVEVHDCKGLYAPVTLDGTELKGWNIFNLRLDDRMLAGLKYDAGQISNLSSRRPAFWRATVNLEKAGDTFLDLRSWGKGVVWVNGHCLGRYWNVGPTQTAYVPGCWLRAGKNEIVILDLLGPEKPVVAGLVKPILDELHPEKDFANVRRPTFTLKLDSATPVLAGSFVAAAASQEMKLGSPATGRFFGIESLNTQDGGPFAA